MKKIFAFIFCITVVSNLFAVETDTLWSKANQLYTEGSYKEAVENYEAILNTGGESAELYYNLGNAYYKQNMLAESILNYERALRLDNKNGDIQHNLEMARLMLLDKIDPLPTFRLKEWYTNFVQLFSASIWGTASIICFAACLLLLLLYFFSKSYSLRKLSFFLGVFALLVSVIFYVLGSQRQKIVTNTAEAIIFSPVVTVKGSPDNSSTDLFIIHEGLKVQIIDEIGNWNRIILSDGNQGWAPAETMQRIYTLN